MVLVDSEIPEFPSVTHSSFDYRCMTTYDPRPHVFASDLSPFEAIDARVHHKDMTSAIQVHALRRQATATVGVDLPYISWVNKIAATGTVQSPGLPIAKKVNVQCEMMRQSRNSTFTTCVPDNLRRSYN